MEHYAGDFFVQLSTEGNGFFILEDGSAGNRFYCPADSHNMLSYQPHETGLHKIHCIVKDDISVSEVDIEVEVKGINGSLTNPGPAYIFTAIHSTTQVRHGTKNGKNKLKVSQSSRRNAGF